MYFSRFTDKAKKAIDLSLESAQILGHKVVGTEHILLGLIRENEDTAAKVLLQLGVTDKYIEQKIIEIKGKSEDKKHTFECWKPFILCDFSE